jgi:rubrerythrin
MAFVNIGDLLKRAGEFEIKLEQYYAAIRDESEDNGVRLLTYYLSKHRRHLQEALDRMEKNLIDHVNKVRLKYDIDFYPEKAFHVMKTPPSEVRGNELLEAAVGYDQELVNLYKQILDHPLSEEARVFIETLIKTEEKDIVMIKKMIAMNYF